MPDIIVINTGPIISIVAATGSLDILNRLYKEVYVPYEVCREIAENSSRTFAQMEFKEALFLKKAETPISISPFLKNILDIGEASVIQLALNKKLQTVCIDEKVGRRVARLNNLSLTGSIGILVKAKNQGYLQSMKNAIHAMKNKGVYLSDNIIEFALEHTNEI
jgi:predicted nucleic acid-binding protein